MLYNSHLFVSIAKTYHQLLCCCPNTYRSSPNVSAKGYYAICKYEFVWNITYKGWYKFVQISFYKPAFNLSVFEECMRIAYIYLSKIDFNRIDFPFRFG